MKFLSGILFVILFCHQVSAQLDSFIVNTQEIYTLNFPFINDNTGFAGGEGGLFRGGNVGAYWWPIYSGNGFDSNICIHDIKFIGNVGYAVGYIGEIINQSEDVIKGLVLKTTDGGDNWAAIKYYPHPYAPPTEIVFNTVTILSATEILIGMNMGKVVRTTNGGDSWTEINAEYFFSLDQHNGLLYGSSFYGLYKSLNGFSWNNIGPSSIRCFASIAKDNKLIALGSDFSNSYLAIAATTDGGATWQSTGFPNELGNFTSALFEGNTIYATSTQYEVWGGQATPSGAIFKSIDQGITWTKLRQQAWGEMYCTTRSTHYIFFGGRGKVFRLNPEITKINPVPIIAQDFGLSQNYPNPFNPTTKISYALPKGSFAKIKIYDAIGKEVGILLNEYKNAGIYTIDFNAANLSSGVYYYELTAGDFKQLKKMMLIK